MSVTVKELIKELEKLPEDYTVELSVFYDNCWHMQSLDRVYSPVSLDINWITLLGAKEE